jgi:hypothetical protein
VGVVWLGGRTHASDAAHANLVGARMVSSLPRPIPLNARRGMGVTRVASLMIGDKNARRSHPELKALALYASATQNAFLILAKCLMNNGALKPGQFPKALKETFNEPDADWSRLDYHYFQQLAAMLEEAEIRDRRDT